jgi:predicted dehydrogenase
MDTSSQLSTLPGDRPVRVAVVGLGYWGPNLARAFDGLPDTELRWLCDLDPEVLGRAASRFPKARATSDLDAVLDDPEVDAVAVATGVPTHRAIAGRAIAAGKHVFVEKPLATSLEDARFLEREAREAGVVLFVGHLLVHHPGVGKLKELCDSGELGDTRYIYTNRVNLGKVRADENALWSLGVHDVAVLLHLLESRPESVSAQGQCFIREGVEDVVFCLLRFPGGVIAHMQLSWLDPHKMRRATIVGSEKMAVFDDMRVEQKVTVYDKGVTTSQPAGQPVNYGEYVQVRSGDTFSPRISPEEPLRIECRQFARSVRGEEAPATGGADGVAVVEVLDALQRSLTAGGAIVLLPSQPVELLG